MLTVGNILRKAREQSGKHLEEVAQVTKIKLQYLQKIENNEFTGFVSSTFVKGFIRSYANFLDLEPEKLVAIYRRQVGEEEKPIKENLKKVATEGFVITPAFVISTSLTVFFITVISILIFQFYRLQQPPRLDIVSPKDQVSETIETTIEISGVTEHQSIVTVNGEQIQLKDDNTFSIKLDLNPGENTFTFIAWKQNLEAKKTEKRIIVTRKDGQNDSNQQGQSQGTQASEVEFTSFDNRRCLDTNRL